MARNDKNPHYDRLRDWMQEYDISFAAIGEQLGVTAPRACQICAGADMATTHHASLVALGFPPEVLPLVCDRPAGRPRKVPRFPGLQVVSNQA